MASEVKFTLSSTDYYYKVEGEITQAVIEQIASKIVTGDLSLASFRLINEQTIVGRVSAGAGFKYQPPGWDGNGFWWAGCDTRKDYNIILTALDSADASGTPSDEPVDIRELEPAPTTTQRTYFLTPTQILFRDGTGALTAPTTGGSGFTGGSQLVHFNTTQYALTTTAYRYSTNDGVDWTNVAEAAKYGVEYDGKLVVITAAGIVKWTDENPADTAGAVISSGDWEYLNNNQSVVPGKTINSMEVWVNKEGIPAIYIGTNWGLYILDWDEEIARPFYKFSYSDSFHCKSITVWNGDLYFSSGIGVYRINRETFTIELVSPNVRDGVYKEVVGRWIVLRALNNYMLGSTDNSGEGSNRRGAVWAYNGKGWHVVSLAFTAGDSIRAFGWTNNILFFSTWPVTGTGNIEIRQFPDTSENPLDLTTSKFHSAIQSLYSPYLDCGFPTVPKIAIAMVVQGRKLAATDTIALAYAADDSETFITTGLSSVTLTSDGRKVITFGTTLGLSFYNLCHRFQLDRGTTNTNTPVLVSAKLLWVPAPTPYYNRVLALDLSAVHRGKGPEQQLLDLETLAAASTMITMVLDNPTKTYTGRLKLASAVRNNSSDNQPGTATIIFEQLV